MSGVAAVQHRAAACRCLKRAPVLGGGEAAWRIFHGKIGSDRLVEFLDNSL